MPYIDSEKQRQYQQDWYKRNRKTKLAQVKERRRKLREAIRSVKVERGCNRCGYNKSASALDAHHYNGDKKFTIARAVHDAMPLELILEELDKCEIVCANCHREEHDVDTTRKEG